MSKAKALIDRIVLGEHHEDDNLADLAQGWSGRFKGSKLMNVGGDVVDRYTFDFNYADHSWTAAQEFAREAKYQYPDGVVRVSGSIVTVDLYTDPELD